MKKILIVLGVALALQSCKTQEKYDCMCLTEDEASRFTSVGNKIYLDGGKVAYLQSFEWEFTPGGKVIQEISIIQIERLNSELTLNLIKYVHMEHPKAKIEINFDDELDKNE